MNSRWERALIIFKQSADSSFEKFISKYFVKIRNSHFASLALIGAVTLTTLPLTTSSIADLQLLSPARADSTTFDAIQEIEKLEVKGRAPKTGYSRSAFGPQWSDVDRNGCDTRNDILKRDLTSIVFRERTRDCVVEKGVLSDPFSGQIIEFQRGEKTSSLVQIDHVVSLSNAWQTGIFQMSQRVRTNFANDPLNLLAVKGSLNSQKGDGDAATWLPPNKPFRCAYVSRQIQVKVKYGLWLTKPEKDAMLRILQSKDCQ
jgi:hypothetical protein